MTKYIFIILLSNFIISCGPRSGISHENEIGNCGVTDQEGNSVNASTETQVNGQKLYTTHCSTCHEPINSHVKDGFRMEGVCYRIPKGNWFKLFILNSDSLKKSNDPYSRKIDYEYPSDFEHNFKSLTDQDIDDIYNYLEVR